MKGLFEDGPRQPPRREDFDEVPEGTVPRMKNEGGYDFSLEESEGGGEIVLEVDVGRFLDTSLIKADVQPLYVRMLIKGRLLCVALPEEISPDRSKAERSKATGRLVVTMPKAAGAGAGANPLLAPHGALRAKKEARRTGRDAREILFGEAVDYKNIVAGDRDRARDPEPLRPVRRAGMLAVDADADADGDDDLPPL